jgi:hypothetical protein
VSAELFIGLALISFGVVGLGCVVVDALVKLYGRRGLRVRP